MANTKKVLIKEVVPYQMVPPQSFLTSSLKKYVFYILVDKQHFVSLCHLILGDTKGILTMFVSKKKYPSGNIGVIVVEKIGGKMKELATIGYALWL